MSAEPAEAEQIQRRGLVFALIIIASLLAVVTTFNTWVERQLLDTDEWVATSDELLADDDIRTALSSYLVEELYDNVDVQAEIEQQLPDDAKFASGPLAAALRRPATEGVDWVLDSAQARRVWRETNRTTHQTLVNVLEGNERENLSTSDGKVVLDLTGLVRSVGEDLGLSSGALDQLEQLDGDAGNITVVESEDLALAQDAVRLIKVLSALLFLVVVGLYALAVYLAGPDGRRLTMRNIGIALVLSGLAVLTLSRLGVNVTVGALVDDSSREQAGLAVGRIATDLLGDLAWQAVTGGVLIVLFAVLVGPAGWAVSVRRAVAPWFRDYPVATWVVLAAATTALVAWSPLAFRNWYTWLLAIALLVVGVEAIRRRALAELREPATDTPEQTVAHAAADDSGGNGESPAQ